MAFEDMTYEVIMARMMERVSEKYPNLDTREGSILFNALASAAVELAIKYVEADNLLAESFVNTASREYILLGCEQIGMDISVFEASAGVHKGVFDVQVAIGSRWNCDLYNYTVTEYLGLDADGHYTYRMDCDTEGTAPNNQTGDLTAITDIPEGLTIAKVTECLIDGENETSDEDIRAAYYEYINNSATDGNVNQYKRWCNDYPGVGNSKIIPLWNGANTVKVCILSATNQAASTELIAEFQEYLDPGSTGMGDGVAPIGAIVTVATGIERPLYLGAKIKLKPGYTFTDTTQKINDALTKYFGEIAFVESNVSYMKVGSVILGVEGVASISNFTMDGKTADITLSETEFISFRSPSWTEVT